MPARQRKTVAKSDKIQPDRFQRASEKQAARVKAAEDREATKKKAQAAKVKAKDKAVKDKAKAKKAAAKEKETAAKAEAEFKTQAAQTAVLKTLKPIAKEIDSRLTKAVKYQEQANDHRLSASLHLAASKKAVEKVGLKFADWAKEHIADQSWQTIRKLAAVGASDNPAEALAEMREKNKVANKKLRDQSGDKAPAKGSAAPASTSVDTALNAIDKMDEGTRKRLIQSVASNEGLKVVEAGADAAETVVVGSTETAKAAFLALPRKDRADFVAWAQDRINLEDEDDGDIPAFLDRRPAGKRQRKTTKK